MMDTDYHFTSDLLANAGGLLSEYFQQPIRFSQVIQVSEPSRRNLIIRLKTDNPATNVPGSFILKKTVTGESGFEGEKSRETEIEQLSRFAHDWAGLELLTEIKSEYAPHFYGGSFEHKYILVEDLGEGQHSLLGSLTRASTSNHLNEAMQALRIFVKRLGGMHADTVGTQTKYLAILNRIYPKALRYNLLPSIDIGQVDKHLKGIIGDVPKAFLKEIESIVSFSQNPNAFNVFIHGDICPDNIYLKDNTIRFIDFEWGDYGHALIDASYLRMGMPSCWCSKTIPLKVVCEMEEIYRKELKKSIPEAGDDEIYNRNMLYSCGYWLIRTLRQIANKRLMENDWIFPNGSNDSGLLWEPQKNAFRPRILSRLESFRTYSELTGYLPEFSKISLRLLIQLQKAWPSTSAMDVYSVFDSVSES